MGQNPAPAPTTLLERFWPHLTTAAGGLALIGLGAADHFVAGVSSWGVGVDLGLIYAGAGALGVTAVAVAAGRGFNA